MANLTFQVSGSGTQPGLYIPTMAVPGSGTVQATSPTGGCTIYFSIATGISVSPSVPNNGGFFNLAGSTTYTFTFTSLDQTVEIAVGPPNTTSTSGMNMTQARTVHVGGVGNV